jgi:hypothetical protein
MSNFRFSGAHTAGFAGMFSKSGGGTKKVGRITGLGENYRESFHAILTFVFCPQIQHIQHLRTQKELVKILILLMQSLSMSSTLVLGCWDTTKIWEMLVFDDKI